MRKIKIGIMTFHWATNYGAVLQTFALQEYLVSRGYAVEIIDYYPKRYEHNFARCFFTKHIGMIKKNLMEYYKEKKIENFRKQYLNRSKRFYSNDELFETKYDVYICGSDQIWNPYFTMNGEGKPTLSYFLNFVPESSLRIAYAASFGTDKISDDVKNMIMGELYKFDAISVRENTAKGILHSIGLNAQVVCDPVVLVDTEKFDGLIDDYLKSFKKKDDRGKYIFKYMLHQSDFIGMKICDQLISDNQYQIVDGNEDMCIGEWLFRLRNAEVVVTNSFHATVFSVLFHKKFISIGMSRSAMNDRLVTFLSAIGLRNKFVLDYKVGRSRVSEIVENNIDWNKIDYEICKMKLKSQDFTECINMGK